MLCLCQGDLERSLGWTPVPLFDRARGGRLAEMQVCCSTAAAAAEWSLCVPPLFLRSAP